MPRRSSPAARKPGFILRRRAQADLEEIGVYTLEHWGDAKLVEYVTMLNDAFRAAAGGRVLLLPGVESVFGRPFTAGRLPPVLPG